MVASDVPWATIGELRVDAEAALRRVGVERCQQRRARTKHQSTRTGFSAPTSRARSERWARWLGLHKAEHFLARARPFLSAPEDPLGWSGRERRRRRSAGGRDRGQPGEGSRLLGGLLLLFGSALLGDLALGSALLRDFRRLLGSGFLSGLGSGLFCSHFRFASQHSGRGQDDPNPRVCCKTYIATYCDVSTKKIRLRSPAPRRTRRYRVACVADSALV
jgi:hypothetical protein